MPTTALGKWSAGLNIVFLVAIIASVILVNALKILQYEDRWWDITVAVAVPLVLIALITGIIAFRKNRDRSGLVILSIITGACAILFGLLHSLFISD